MACFANIIVVIAAAIAIGLATAVQTNTPAEHFLSSSLASITPSYILEASSAAINAAVFPEPHFFSPNTSGAGVFPIIGEVNSVAATWSVPEAQLPTDANFTSLPFVETFISIDWFGCPAPALAGIQIFLREDFIEYLPFYQWGSNILGGFDNVNVQPGDTVKVGIQTPNRTTGVFSISVNSGAQFQEISVTAPNHPLCLTNAAWIVGGSSSNSIANFSEVLYQEASATLRGGGRISPTTPISFTVDIERNGTMLTKTDVSSQSVGVRYVH